VSTGTDETAITNGELFRAVTLIRGDIKDLKTDVEAKPTQRDFAYLENAVKDLENWQTWAIRLGVPALIGVVFNLVNTVKEMGH